MKRRALDLVHLFVTPLARTGGAVQCPPAHEKLDAVGRIARVEILFAELKANTIIAQGIARAMKASCFLSGHLRTCRIARSLSWKSAGSLFYLKPFCNPTMM